MSASPSSVSAFASAPAGGGRLGRESPQGVWRWCFKRNCSMAPRQLLAGYLLLAALALAIAAFFWWQGAPMVLPFAGLELLGLGAAMLVYARHAADRESIELTRLRVHVEHRCGNRLEQAEFDPAWVRIEPVSSDLSLIELSARGRRIAVGRFIRPELRPLLADELRKALRRTRVSAVAPAIAPADALASFST